MYIRACQARISLGMAFLVFFIVGVSTLAVAASVRLPSSQVVHPTENQVQLLKRQPGVYVTPSPPQGSTNGYTVMKLPEELAGSFLVARTEDLTRALDAAGAALEAEAAISAREAASSQGRTASEVNPFAEGQSQSNSEEVTADSTDEDLGLDEDLDFLDEEIEEEKIVEVPDPLQGFNRAMYTFNDRLYFWVLKPVARGYRAAVPEQARISVRDFFYNLLFPVRFVNCLLQANFNGAAVEVSRFMTNTIVGIGGLFDVATKGPKLPKQNEDLGQTLGAWGFGNGFYLHWPIFGPSSPRDTAGLVGDLFLDPVSYVQPWYVSVGINAYKKVNNTSLTIGDYEALKEAAIDPYIAVRDAYFQYRDKQVKTGWVEPGEDKDTEEKRGSSFFSQ